MHLRTLVHLRTLLPLVASVKIWPVCNLYDLHFMSCLMVWLIVHLEVFNSSDMRLMDLVGSSSIISCTLVMKSESLVFLASYFDFLLPSNTAESSLVSFRAFLMSKIVFSESPKALEIAALVTSKLVFTNHCKTAHLQSRSLNSNSIFSMKNYFKNLVTLSRGKLDKYWWNFPKKNTG